jgi:hypothetical protein
VAHEDQIAIGVVGEQFKDARCRPGVELPDCLAPRGGGVSIDHPPSSDTQLARAYGRLGHTFGGAEGTFAEPTVEADRQT